MNFRTVLNFLSETSLVNLDKNTKRLDIEYMICYVFNLERFDLYVNPPRITIREEELLLSMISRRNKGEPLAYILGSKHFWNLELTLNKHVMVPRPETETLIFAVLNQFGEEPVVVLDAGTASTSVTDGIKIAAGHSWFANLPNTTVADIHAISSSSTVTCIVAALLDDVG